MARRSARPAIPYFSHPIEVAGILTDLKLDDQTIATAILHDTIEDTLATPKEIEKLFGKDVARLVDGVTKLSKIEAQSENERAAENLRKFLLALSDDIRVLLVKLADRLHNMRTLHHVPSDEKRGGSLARRWISMRRSPSGSACTR
jgi:GTP diphosphokinase / guanosine-3',5'-bis(diphosphate) 3'-diphosphatase